MQNTNRVSTAIVAASEVVAGGVPVVIWGLADATVETVNIKETDGEGAASNTVILTQDFTATLPVVSFPFGIQCPNGVAVTDAADVVTVLYTVI